MKFRALVLALVLSPAAYGMGSRPAEPTPVPSPPAPVPAPAPKPAPKPSVVGEETRARYGKIKDATAKLVDNRGNGYEALYGVRNFRAVLNGVYYRGGANNAYHRTAKRENENPLPSDGLMNLCEEGFSDAVYLYPTNFSTAPKTTRCRTADGAENVLTYQQITGLTTSNGRKLMSLVYDHVRDPRRGVVYMHCWNGWHASGYVGAITLRQFCGFTAEQAVQYWNKNIDGVEVGENVRTAIRAFKPFAEFSLSAEEKAALCPDGSSLKFR